MHDRQWIVVVILALGIAIAINLITVAVLYDAIFSEGPGLSDNATQLLTAAFGGITGILGSYIGFRAGQNGYFNELRATRSETGQVRPEYRGSEESIVPSSGTGHAAVVQPPGESSSGRRPSVEKREESGPAEGDVQG